MKPVGLSVLQTIEVPDHDAFTTRLPDEPDVCELAAELPPEDPCSLICDPDALEDALLDAGVEPGRCYLMICEMSEDVIAKVGICL